MTNLEWLIKEKKIVAVEFDTRESCREYGARHGVGWLDWLYEEHIEKPTLNKYERALCEAIGTEYGDYWIAAGERVSPRLFKGKPYKDRDEWIDGERHNIPINILEFYSYNPNIRFDFIKWEDAEPWSIEELLKLEVK